MEKDKTILSLSNARFLNFGTRLCPPRKYLAIDLRNLIGTGAIRCWYADNKVGSTMDSVAHRALHNDKSFAKYYFGMNKTTKILDSNGNKIPRKNFIKGTNVDIVARIYPGTYWRGLGVKRVVEKVIIHDTLHEQPLVNEKTTNINLLPDETAFHANRSAVLSHSVKLSFRRKQQLGECWGKAPRGYINIRDHTDHYKSKILKDPEQFPKMRKAFDLLLLGCYSVLEISEIIEVNPAFLKKAFGNVFYAGFIRDTDNPKILYKGKWEPVVTKKEFDMAQKILENLKKRPNAKTA